MPMPKPKKGETHDDFMGRCMGDSTMMSDFPKDEDPKKGTKQRYAVCQKQWDAKSEKGEFDSAFALDRDGPKEV